MFVVSLDASRCLDNYSEMDEGYKMDKSCFMYEDCKMDGDSMITKQHGLFTGS